MFLVDDNDNPCWCTTFSKGNLCQGTREVTDKPRRFVLCCHAPTDDLRALKTYLWPKVGELID